MATATTAAAAAVAVSLVTASAATTAPSAPAASKPATTASTTTATTTTSVSVPAPTRGLKKTKSSSSLPGNLNAEKAARSSSFDPSPLHIQKVHQPKPYSERTKEELIYEIDFMKEKLKVAHASVSNSRAALTLQKQRTRNAVTAWRHRVDECRSRLRSDRAAHDQQMATIVSSLLAFEEQLKQEQKTIVKTLEEKDSQIVAQQRRIESLTTANERLMKAMGRKQRSASVDHWSELSEDETLLTPRASSSASGGSIMNNVSLSTATSSMPGGHTYPGYSTVAASFTGASSPLHLPTPNGLYPSYATVPRVARATTPKQQSHYKPALHQQQQQHQQEHQQQQQPSSSTIRPRCDTLKEISNMKLPGSGGVYGRAGALRLILSSTTSESEDSRTNAKKSASAKKNNNNSNNLVSNGKVGAGMKEDAGATGGVKSSGGGGGGARLVRRASASFRNWLSGSDRSDDDEARESGWYSDYDLTSYRRHAVHLNNDKTASSSRAASNAAIVAGLAAASSNSNGRGSTLSRTFKSLLSPNAKISTRRSKSPRVPVACSAAVAAASAMTPIPGAVSSSSEDLAF